MTQTCSSAYKHTEIVFTFKEVHSFPFLKTQDSLALFDMCLISVGPEVQRNFRCHKRHTRRVDAAGGGQGSQGGSHGDATSSRARVLSTGAPADAGWVRESTQGVAGCEWKTDRCFSKRSRKSTFFFSFPMTFYKCQPLSPPFFFPRSIQHVCRQDCAHRSSCDLWI